MPGYVITKPIKMEEKKTQSGILIPVGQKVRGRLEETQQGEIHAINGDEMGLLAGDHVIYGEFAGFESDIDGQRYRFLKIEDIRAKITE